MNKNALTVAVLVCFVISSVTADNYDEMVDPRLIQLLQIANLSDQMIFKIDQKIVDSYDLLQKMCLENNQSALLTVMNQFSTMQNDIIKKLYDISHDHRSKDPSVVIKNYCKQSRELKNILEYYANFVKLCSNEKETKKVENGLNFIEILVSTVCLDDAKFLISVYSDYNNLMKCYETKKDYFHKCVDYETDDANQGTGSNTLVTKSSGNDSQKDICKFMEQAKLCIVKEMNNCENLKSGDILVSAYDNVSRSTFCSQYSTSITSSPSSSHKIGSNIFAATALSMIIVTYFNKFLII